MQYPTKETKWRWCMRLIMSTSALNSLSPWLPPILSCFTAISLPSGKIPLYTEPNPPSPKRFRVEKPFVALISSSYENQFLEWPIPPPGSDGVCTTSLLTRGVEAACILKKDESGQIMLQTLTDSNSMVRNWSFKVWSW